MKKIIVLISLILCLTGNLFCKSLYDGADNDTQLILQEVDELLEKKMYQTAFNTVSSEVNEFYLAKKIEIAINGFALSMMHQMFAFKDLEENETLYDVRTAGNMSLPMVLFDPADAIKKFVEKNGEKPILDYALGAYYQDVLDRYNSQWLISNEELLDKVIVNLQKAKDQDCYDDYSLSTLATSYFRVKNYDAAAECYKFKESVSELNETDNYHYGIILWIMDNGKKGLEYEKKAIAGYKDNPEYQSDAYIFAIRIALDIPDYKEAEKLLTECKKKHSADYRTAQYGITLYSLQNNLKKSLTSAMTLYEFGTGNPSTCQMIMKEYNDSGKPDFAIEFFKEALKKYGNDNKACENLYFHYAYQYYLMNEAEKAAEIAVKAREYFIINDDLTDDVDGLLKQLAGEIQ